MTATNQAATKIDLMPSIDAAKVAALKAFAAEGITRRPSQALDAASCNRVRRYPVRAVASRSRGLVRRDLLDLRREHVFGHFEIEARLNVHPERTAGLEELAEP
jgi:hypothetical protein